MKYFNTAEDVCPLYYVLFVFKFTLTKGKDAGVESDEYILSKKCMLNTVPLVGDKMVTIQNNTDPFLWKKVTGRIFNAESSMPVIELEKYVGSKSELDKLIACKWKANQDET